MSDTYLQVRTTEADKQAASEVLSELGTNLSAVVNMLLKQIVLTKSVPFDIRLPENRKRVSPFRTEDLKAVLSHVPESAEEIWVFGSTVTEYCRPQSDLDLCIIGFTSMEEESKMYHAAKCSVDIITETPEGFDAARKIKGGVYNEVYEKGLLVYKKGANISWN